MLRDQDFPISIEVQFLGGLRDGKPRPTGNVCSPGTRVVYAGEPDATHCIQSSAADDRRRRVGHGRRARARATSASSTTSTARPSSSTAQITYGGANVNGHSPAAKPDGMPLGTGFIALQSESHPIQFRRVELLNLERRETGR